ncbi:MAG TPA: YceD family protein [Acetobacteraceae bacterium]|nr:YceD family protein [Acetobacteraceae bacterium]
MSAPIAVELHRPFAVERVGGAGREQVVEASAAECAALAKRLNIPAVLSLRCTFRLTLESGGVVLAEGALEARLVRDCVVSLEPFETAVAERFRLRFVPAELLAEADEDALLDPDADDEIPYDGAAIDLGEAAAEQLALAMDPYPRRPGAALPDEASEAAESPFAALSRLRREEH